MEWNWFSSPKISNLWVYEVKVEGVVSNTSPKSNTCACLLIPSSEYIFNHPNASGAKAGANLGDKGDGFQRMRGQL